MDTIRLKPATARDAELLLEWRNDPDTVNSSHETGKVQREEHRSWLSRIIGTADRHLLVAEEKGSPVGTVRADFSNGVYELSWTVAPDYRGRGLGKQMIAMVARQITAPIRAEVKSNNVASVRIAEHAGMVFEREVNGVLHFTRPAQKQQTRKGE